ncbi:MAG: hypothetical protein ACYDDP_08520 [Acidithiobacillus sp.]
MNLLYSFVVDAGEKFLRQTTTFLKTILACGVQPEQLVAQITPSAGAAAHKLVRSYRVTSVELEPHLDGRYCNKIEQLSFLHNVPSDSVVLCDTDLAFAESITSAIHSSRIYGKPVDFANPPIEQLNQLAAMAGITSSPPLARTTCTGELTWRSNCNGGLYVLPHAILRDLQPLWSKYASLALGASDILGNKTHHADQIGFAMAIVALNLDINELPVEYNFPMHVPQAFERMCFDTPKILHYHDKQTQDGFLLPTGYPKVDYT